MKKKKKKIERPPRPSFLPRGLSSNWSTVEYIEDKQWKKKTFQDTKEAIKFFWEKDDDWKQPSIRRATIAESFPPDLPSTSISRKEYVSEPVFILPPPPSPKPYRSKTSKNGQEVFTGVQKCIARFLEEWDGRPDINGEEVATGYTEYYLGLYSFLYEEGFKKSAKRMLKHDGSFLKDINAAWRIYRKRHPFINRPLDDEKAINETISQKKPGGRKKLWGHNISSILRVLGKEGMNFDEAKKVMQHFGIDVIDKTVRGQLWCGTKRGKFGKIPKLLEWQLNELFAPLSKKEKSIKKTN